MLGSSACQEGDDDEDVQVHKLSPYPPIQCGLRERASERARERETDRHIDRQTKRGRERVRGSGLFMVHSP